jgi:hypothetical protein
MRRWTDEATLRQPRLLLSGESRIRPMLGFKQLENAASTIAGIELLHRIRKGQFALGRLRMSGTAAPEIWNAVMAA